MATFTKTFKTGLSITIISFLMTVFSGLNFLSAQTTNNLYYIPLPDEQIHSSLKVFTTAFNKSIGNEMRTIISLTCTEDNASIYYDHREDGYEADIPSCLPNQNSNTQIK